MYELPLTADQLANFQIGDLVAVDWDDQGQTGYVGAGTPGAYMASALDVASHVDFIRKSLSMFRECRTRLQLR